MPNARTAPFSAFGGEGRGEVAPSFEEAFCLIRHIRPSTFGIQTSLA
jgi:hypothetical protein